MQQIAIFDYVTTTIDIYTVDSSIDAEEFITEELGLKLKNVAYLTKPDIIKLTIHCDD